jgi:aminoglycoside phosphotransferase (APT) family kinase protein
MDSQTKKRLDESELVRLVKAGFGEGVTIEAYKELTEGWFNAAYSIRLNDGLEVVLKLSPPTGTKMMRYENDIMRVEVEVLQMLGGLKQIPVPKVFYYDSSKLLIDCEYFFMELIEGQSYKQVKESLSRADQEAIESELGRYNRLINEIKGDHFGYYAQDGQCNRKWSEVFNEMIMDVLRDGQEAGVKLPMDYEWIEKEINNRLPALDIVTEPRLVDWDLWEGNVFVQDGRIVGLIDFERALWGDSLMEFYFGRLSESEAFNRGYGDGLVIGNSKERRKLYNLLFDLILCIECPYRKYDNKEHIQWAYDNLAEGWENFLEN